MSRGGVGRHLKFCPACGHEFEEPTYGRGRLNMVGTHLCRDCGFRFRIDEDLMVHPVMKRLEDLEAIPV